MSKQSDEVGVITPGQMSEFWRQVKIGEISKKYFQNFLDHELELKNQILRLISRCESLVIEPTDGSRTIAQAEDVFAFIEPSFRKLNESGVPTGETCVQVYEMRKDAIYSEIFGSLVDNVNIKDLLLTQHQIIVFCQKYREWIKSDVNSDTFFLFKNTDGLFVAQVCEENNCTLSVTSREFASRSSWLAENVNQVVVPLVDSI